MQKMVKTGAAALMLTGMAANVFAASASAAGCARPEDMTALKAAAVQQKLMVAALTCDAVKLYNDFVRSYQKDLQASDKALQNFFRRVNGVSGTDDYHAYKTRLANSSSMQSIGNLTAYCADAKTIFDASVGTTEKTNLSVFVSGQTTSVDNAYTLCPVLTAGAAGRPPEKVPLPKLKPGDTVTPAVGGGLSAAN
jgi:hypothetical protein